MKKILITGALETTDDFIFSLNKMGYEIVNHKDEREIVPSPEQYEIIVCNALFLYNDIKNFANLKYIQLTSAGYDRVPMDYINENNIKIYNARGVYSTPIAEFAVCGILQLYKQSVFFHENQKNHKWIKHRGLLELYNKNVCIIGAGDIGNHIAKRLKSFDTNITGVDIYPNKTLWFDECVHLDELKNIIPDSDIVILSLPLTYDTKNFYNNEKFDLMCEGAIFINISRGELVDELALINALITGKLGGAVLDVFQNEPLDEKNPLWDMKNVIITPHNSFIGNNNRERMYNLIYSNLLNGIIKEG